MRSFTTNFARKKNEYSWRHAVPLYERDIWIKHIIGADYIGRLVSCCVRGISRIRVTFLQDGFLFREVAPSLGVVWLVQLFWILGNSAYRFRLGRDRRAKFHFPGPRETT